MRRVRVKVCGLTREEDLEMVCRLGADAVGFVVGVPSSPRNLTLERAKKLIEHVPIFVKSVLVTVPQSVAALLELYRVLKPDIIQVHGEKPLDFSTLREKLEDAILVKGVSVKSEESIQEAVEAAEFFNAVLVDSYSVGRYGGTGLTHDWGLSKRIREAIHPKPLILAGGLNPENVKEAVEIVKPYAVDVSTGVELKPGIKDPTKVEAFIRNVMETVSDKEACRR